MSIDLDMDNRCIRIDGTLFHLVNEEWMKYYSLIIEKYEALQPTKESIDVPKKVIFWEKDKDYTQEELIYLYQYGYIDVVDLIKKMTSCKQPQPQSEATDALEKMFIESDKKIKSELCRKCNNYFTKVEFLTHKCSSEATIWKDIAQNKKTISYKELEEATNIFGRSIDILEHFKPK